MHMLYNLNTISSLNLIFTVTTDTDYRKPLRGIGFLGISKIIFTVTFTVTAVTL